MKRFDLCGFHRLKANHIISAESGAQSLYLNLLILLQTDLTFT